MPRPFRSLLGVSLTSVLLTGGLMTAAPAFATTQVTFTSPGLDSWTVPEGVTQVTITAIGGAGGAGLHSLGGSGCTVTHTYSVAPGDEFRIFVGGGGGGATGTRSGGGGGSTSINLQQFSMIVAGGGGGGGGYDNVDPATYPNDGGDGCGGLVNGGTGVGPNGRAGNDGVGGAAGGAGGSSGGSGLAGPGGDGIGNAGSGGTGDVCSFGNGGAAATYGGGGGGGGYGGGGSGADMLIGSSGSYLGGGGGGGSTGPTGASFTVSTARTANTLSGRNGSVLISFNTPGTAPSWFQAYARGASVDCLPGWNPSWAQWPGDGAGGYVCNREIYMTPTGTWSSRSATFGTVITQRVPVRAFDFTRTVISYRC